MGGDGADLLFVDSASIALRARGWVGCLNRIRREVLPDARWSVSIDDRTLLWSDKSGWHYEASDGLATLWLGCLLSAPFRLFTK